MFCAFGHRKTWVRCPGMLAICVPMISCTYGSAAPSLTYCPRSAKGVTPNGRHSSLSLAYIRQASVICFTLLRQEAFLAVARALFSAGVENPDGCEYALCFAS